MPLEDTKSVYIYQSGNATRTFARTYGREEAVTYIAGLVRGYRTTNSISRSESIHAEIGDVIGDCFHDV